MEVQTGPESQPFATGNAYHTVMLDGCVMNVGVNNPYVIVTAHDAAGSLCLTYSELAVMVAKHFAEQQAIEAKALEMMKRNERAGVPTAAFPDKQVGPKRKKT